MPAQEQKGPFCQSCAMPLGKPEDFGTDKAGYRVNDYCHYCFANGVFTDPTITMQAMLDKCVAIMAQQGVMPEPRARALMMDVFPRLKRWRSPVGAA
jgi:hypothetical protein